MPVLIGLNVRVTYGMAPVWGIILGYKCPYLPFFESTHSFTPAPFHIPRSGLCVLFWSLGRVKHIIRCYCREAEKEPHTHPAPHRAQQSLPAPGDGKHHNLHLNGHCLPQATPAEKVRSSRRLARGNLPFSAHPLHKSGFNITKSLAGLSCWVWASHQLQGWAVWGFFSVLVGNFW